MQRSLAPDQGRLTILITVGTIGRTENEGCFGALAYQPSVTFRSLKSLPVSWN